MWHRSQAAQGLRCLRFQTLGSKGGCAIACCQARSLAIAVLGALIFLVVGAGTLMSSTRVSVDESAVRIELFPIYKKIFLFRASVTAITTGALPRRRNYRRIFSNSDDRRSESRRRESAGVSVESAPGNRVTRPVIHLLADLVDLRPAAADMKRVRTGITPDVLQLQIPCTEFTVTDLLSHCQDAAGNLTAAAARDSRDPAWQPR